MNIKSILLVGIAAVSLNAHAELLFEDNFSGSITHSNQNFRWLGSAKVVIGQHEDRFGTRRPMMEFTYRALDSSGSSDDKHWAEQRFELERGYPVIAFSFWLRVPDNYTHSGSGNNNNKLFMFWMDGYSSAGDGSTVGMEYRPSGGGSYFYGKVSGGNGSLLGSDQGRAEFISTGDRGRWMQLVGRITVESRSGANDGKLEVWRRWHGEGDFEKTHNLTNQSIRVPSGGPNGIANGYLLGYANSGFQQQTTFWVDDFKIGTTVEDVGMGDAMVRPSPPQLNVK